VGEFQLREEARHARIVHAVAFVAGPLSEGARYTQKRGAGPEEERTRPLRFVQGTSGNESDRSPCGRGHSPAPGSNSRVGVLGLRINTHG
jgi:hypothetical protein